MFVWRQLCLIQFAILLFVYAFLGLTGTPENYVPMFNDKLMHCGGYIVAAFSISFAFPRLQFWKRAVFLIAFSIGIEIGQHFLPPRTFDFFDICANSTGVITGLTLIFLLEKYLGWFKRLLYLKEQQI
jgi:VanZ family protein